MNQTERMEITVKLQKFYTQIDGTVQYYLANKNEPILINDWIGKSIKISYQNQINCLNCNATTKKSFFQGYCYKCFSTLPQTDASVINPELCLAHEGISRNMEWAKKNCLIDHYVYLSVTSGVKVGVTRHTQIPTRWIDQGAEQAIILAQTPYRQLAGLIEVELKQYVSDKTAWQRMLKGSAENHIDLVEEKDRLIEYLPEEYHEFISDDDSITHIKYPVTQYPEKIKSINLDKTNEFEGILSGIKGQYLLFEDGYVFNARKHGGYSVKFSV